MGSMSMDAYDFIAALRMLRHAQQHINDQTTGPIHFGDQWCSEYSDEPLLDAMNILEDAEHLLIEEIL